MADDCEHWTVDRRIPIASILALIAQTVVVVYLIAGLFHRVDNLEKDSTARGPQADRLTRVEVRLENVQDVVTEIKRLIQQKP
jgi:hypothetical protein